MSDVYGAMKNQSLAAATTATGVSAEIGIKGYSVLLLDLSMTIAASVSFEARGVNNYRNIMGTFLDGSAAATSATANGLVRFNIAGCEGFRVNVGTNSGAVTADATAMKGGTAITT